MRLSEAIALGRTLGLPWEMGNRGDGRYCALQLAGLAANGDAHNWLKNIPFIQSSFDGEQLTVPCDCIHGEWLTGSKTTNVHRAIMHMFNHHVCTVGDWTLDQLIDWVRSVEPAEPAPAAAEQQVAEAEVPHGVK